MKPAPNIFLGVLFLSGLAFLSGCVSKPDFEVLQRDQENNSKEFLALQRNVQALNVDMRAQLDDLKKRTAEMKKEITDLKGEVKSKVGFLEKEMETSNQPMRRNQADLGARIDKLQMDVQTLTGRVEEAKYFSEKNLQENKTLRDSYQAKIEDLDKRIAETKKSLEGPEKKAEGIEKEGTPEKASPEMPGKVEGTKTQPPAKGAETPAKTGPATPDDAYKKAYDLYNKGNVAAAREEFKRFLQANPKSKYAENAHFWLGECYFSEKKYDEAILEFDEVLKQFPKGNKVPDALFRQGMAFLEMKDTMNAKLIFKEVIKRYPKSDQANRARKKLKDLP